LASRAPGPRSRRAGLFSTLLDLDDPESGHSDDRVEVVVLRDDRDAMNDGSSGDPEIVDRHSAPAMREMGAKAGPRGRHLAVTEKGFEDVDASERRETAGSKILVG